jgi:hypothetical protein
MKVHQSLDLGPLMVSLYKAHMEASGGNEDFASVATASIINDHIAEGKIHESVRRFALSPVDHHGPCADIDDPTSTPGFEPASPPSNDN